MFRRKNNRKHAPKCIIIHLEKRESARDLLELVDVIGEALSLVVDELLGALLEGAERLRGEEDAGEDAQGEDRAGDAPNTLLGIFVGSGRLGVQLPGLNGEDVAVTAVVLADVTGGAVELLASLDHGGHAALGDHGPERRLREEMRA